MSCPQEEEYGSYNYNQEIGALGLTVLIDHSGQKETDSQYSFRIARFVYCANKLPIQGR